MVKLRVKDYYYFDLLKLVAFTKKKNSFLGIKVVIFVTGIYERFKEIRVQFFKYLFKQKLVTSERF